jgi:hypothetical protein
MGAMSDTSRGPALGILGAAIVVTSTFVSWYTFDVAVSIAGVADVFVVPVTLWNYAPIAAALLVLAAVVGVALYALPPELASRPMRIGAGVLGLAVAAYALYRCLDVPELGLPAAAGRTDTTVDGGPFLALGGGILQALGALPALMRKREEPGPGTPEERFERAPGAAVEREAPERRTRR